MNKFKKIKGILMFWRQSPENGKYLVLDKTTRHFLTGELISYSSYPVEQFSTLKEVRDYLKNDVSNRKRHRMIVFKQIDLNPPSK